MALGVEVARCAEVLVLGLSLPLLACESSITVSSSYVGSHGLQGLEGEVEGRPVSVPGYASLLISGLGRWEEYLVFEDLGWLVMMGEGSLNEEGAYDLDRGFLHMPQGQPLASRWVCAGAGSTLTRHGDETHEASLEDLTIMGSCVDAPEGPYMTTAILADGPEPDTWTGSSELHLDGARLSGLLGNSFLARTDHGEAWLWFLPDADLSSDLPSNVPIPLQEGAVLVPDPSGDVVLACAGPGSTFMRIPVSDGDADYQLQLRGVSIIGQCPGTPTAGSLVARYYHGQ